MRSPNTQERVNYRGEAVFKHEAVERFLAVRQDLLHPGHSVNTIQDAMKEECGLDISTHTIGHVLSEERRAQGIITPKMASSDRFHGKKPAPARARPAAAPVMNGATSNGVRIAVEAVAAPGDVPTSAALKRLD
jgi:hypothetical protein